MKPLVHFDENATGAGGVTPPPVVTPPAAPPSLTGAPSEPPKVDPAAPVVDPAKPAEPKVEPSAPFALDKVKLPDGLKADDPKLKEFGDFLANDKLSPLERGQALLDLYAGVAKQGREAATEAWNNVQKDWQTKTLADPVIGGAKWNVSQATIAKAIDTLGPDLAAGFREALDVTGAGNHPAVSKALHAWATKLTEGSHVGGTPPAAPPSIKDAFYPNSPDMK
jgi:hypothetical protein